MSAATDNHADPTWFPVGLDAQAQQVRLVHTTRADLSAAPFLDERFNPEEPDFRSISFEEGSQMASGPARVSVPAFIFHTAFCCSTLLARALDQPGRALSLKEPGILMDLANLGRVHPKWAADTPRFQSLAQTVFGLLGRRFEPQEHVVIKPTNAANRLLWSAVAQGSRVLLLYSNLPSFLVSVIRKGEACRHFMRRLLNILRLDRPDIDAWPHRELILLTDLQVAALVWHLQIQLFELVLARVGTGSVRSLNTDRFIDRPADVLFDVQAFFGLGYTAQEISDVAGGSLFQRHAKFLEQEYDHTLRQAEKEQMLERHREDISTTLEWVRRLRGSDVPERMARPL